MRVTARGADFAGRVVMMMSVMMVVSVMIMMRMMGVVVIMPIILQRAPQGPRTAPKQPKAKPDNQ